MLDGLGHYQFLTSEHTAWGIIISPLHIYFAASLNAT